jgi:hypothetical protein
MQLFKADPSIAGNAANDLTFKAKFSLDRLASALQVSIED